jgi:peptidyl-prolyl cis-trans isomerase C
VTRWLREPLLAFMALGAGLFLVYDRLGPSSGDAITLGSAGLAVLVEDYEAVTGSAADATRRQDIIDDYYRREVLFREALRTGLHESDPALREAMIERMQQIVAGELPEPSGRDLVNYYADNIERYYSEPSISLSQRFLRDAPHDSDDVLSALEEGREPAFDPPPGGRDLPRYGESMLRGLFGGAVLERLRSLPVGRWAGPFESPRGWHFFRVDDRHPRELLPFEFVQAQVRADYQNEAINDRLDKFVARNRDRYPFRIEDEPG